MSDFVAALTINVPPVAAPSMVDIKSNDIKAEDDTARSKDDFSDMLSDRQQKPLRAREEKDDANDVVVAVPTPVQPRDPRPVSRVPVAANEVEHRKVDAASDKGDNDSVKVASGAVDTDTTVPQEAEPATETAEQVKPAFDALLAIVEASTKNTQLLTVTPVNDNVSDVAQAQDTTLLTGGIKPLKPTLLNTIQQLLGELEEFTQPVQDVASAQDHMNVMARPTLQTLQAHLTQLNNFLTKFLQSAENGGVTLDKTAFRNMLTEIRDLSNKVAADIQALSQNDSRTLNFLNQLMPQPDVKMTNLQDRHASMAEIVRQLQSNMEMIMPKVEVQAPLVPVKHITELTATPVTVSPIPQDATGHSTTDSGQQNLSNGSPQMAMPMQAVLTQTTPVAGPAKGSFDEMLADKAARPVADQVMVHVKTAVQTGVSKITIQLDPVSLGKLDITLEVGPDGKTGMVITADNKHALQALQQDTQNLQQALRDAGLKSDSGSLSFNLRGDQQGQGQQQNDRPRYTSYDQNKEDDLLLTATRSYQVQMQDGLDITI